MKNKITPSQWNELTNEGKQKLCLWALHHKYELDMIPGETGDFSPSCEYAALLTVEQMTTYLQEEKQHIKSNDSDALWEQIKSEIEGSVDKNY